MESLERRDVPALFSVSLAQDAFTKGESGANLFGSLSVTESSIEADTWQDAVRLSVDGSAGQTLNGSKLEYGFLTNLEPNDAAPFANKRFRIGTVTDVVAGNGKNNLTSLIPDNTTKVIAFEDWTDNDFDDAYWVVNVKQAEPVAGTVWQDDDADGIQGVDEPIMPFVSVQLLKDPAPYGDPVVAQTTVTADDGTYSFEVFKEPDTQYFVQFSGIDGYSFTSAFAGGDRTTDSDADPVSGRSLEVFTSSVPADAIGNGLVPFLAMQTWKVRAPAAAEGNGAATNKRTFTVTRQGDISQATTVDYTTIDGTAVAGQDYTAKSGTLQFAANVGSLTVDVDITEDTTKENDEEFFLVLKVPSFTIMPADTVEGRRTPFGRGIIRNDDFPAGYQDTWAGWTVDPHKTTDDGYNYENGTWMRGWDGDTPTYITPGGTPWVHSMTSEGPYLKTNANYGAFRMTVDWRIKDVGKAATPMYPTGEYRSKQNAEHFGNSGVYIYDRYEVQIISSAAPNNQPVPAQPPSSETQLTPGWPYKVPAPTPQDAPVNRSKAPGQWNRMEIEFTPPTVNNGKITQAAKLKVTFIIDDGSGNVTRLESYGGANAWDLVANGKALKGTGSRDTSKSEEYLPTETGNLFLQSHWGSLVEYKNPVIAAI